MAKESCSVIVYENGTIKRVILIEGDQTMSNIGRVAELVFTKTLEEESNQGSGDKISVEELEAAIEDGHIEVNGGRTEVYITWPEKTINADTYKE
jgi:hypothetical protein